MDLDRKQVPPFNKIKDFKLLKPVERRLDNGLPLYALNAGSQPVCNIQILLRAGRRYETAKSVSSFTAKMLFEGNQKHSAADISRIFDEVGAYWEVNSGMDMLSIDIYVMAKYLEVVLQTVRDSLEAPAFPGHEFDSLKARTMQQMKVNLEKTSYVAGLNFREKVFGIQHPYGYASSLTSLRENSLDEVWAYFDASIKHRPFDIILSGQAGEAEINLVNQIMGSMEVRESIRPLQEDIFAPNKPIRAYIEREDASQTSVRLGKRLFLKNDPDAIRFEVMNEVLGGYFGSRLMKNIREKKGFTYGIYSNMVYLQKAGYFVIGSDLIKEKRGEAIEEIYREIDLLSEEKVPGKELETVKNYMAGNFVKSISSPLAVSEYFKTIHYNELPTDYFDQYISKINQVTAEDIQQMAQKYLSANFVEVMVG